MDNKSNILKYEKLFLTEHEIFENNMMKYLTYINDKQIIIDYVITNKTPTYMLMNAFTLTESQIVIIYKQRATFGKNDKIIQESKKLSFLCNKEAIIHNYPSLFMNKLNHLS